MIVTVFIVFIGLYYCVEIFKLYLKKWNALRSIPGPKRKWLIGNAHQVERTPEGCLRTLLQLAKDHNNELMRFYLGPVPFLIIADPKCAEEVLSNINLTSKEIPYKFLKPWLGEGLFTSSGKQWMNRRKLVIPIFHMQMLMSNLCIINDTTDRFMRLLDTYAEKGEIFDFQNVINLCTVDIICEIAMGIKVNAIENKHSPIPQAIEELCYATWDRFLNIFKQPDFLFQFTKTYQTQNQALKIMEGEISKAIESRTNTLTKDESATTLNKTVLDFLLTLKVDGEKLNFNQIFGEINSYIFAGHDTVSISLAFTTFCLSRHPKIQQKAFEEQYKIFGNDPHRQPTYQELKSMSYLEMVIKESLRLFPSAPVIFRHLHQDCEIGGHIIPKDVTIILSIMAIGIGPNIHKDPFEFKPERFHPEQRTSSKGFDFVSFSAGPRNCIGQKQAMLQMKIILSKMIRQFEILPPIEGLSTGIRHPCDLQYKAHPKYDPILEVLLTLRSANGILIRLKKRNN